MLWKHVDHAAGAEVRRARRLVVSFHVTVANYEYLVYWRFYQDGNIECEVRATGIMVTCRFAGRRPAAQRDARRRAHLRAVPPAFHRRPARPGRRRRGQHGLRDRVGGAARSAPATPTASAWCQRETPLRTESEGIAGLRLGTAAGLEGRQPARHATGSARRSGTSSCRAALPADVRPGLPVLRRAEVIGHTLWVTPYRRGRALAVRRFPTQSADGHAACPAGRRRPADRGHRRRALVRLRHPPRHPARGLAGDARRHRSRSGSSRSASSTATRARRPPVRPPPRPLVPGWDDLMLAAGERADGVGAERIAPAVRPTHRHQLRHLPGQHLLAVPQAGKAQARHPADTTRRQAGHAEENRPGPSRPGISATSRRSWRASPRGGPRRAGSR